MEKLNKAMNQVLEQFSSLLDAMEAEGLGTENEDVVTWPLWAQEQHLQVIRHMASLNQQIAAKHNF